MSVFLLVAGPVLGCNFRAQLKHVKTLVGYSVGRFWPGTSPENPPRPVGLTCKRDAPPPSRFGWRRRARDARSLHRSRRPFEASLPPPPVRSLAAAVEARLRIRPAANQRRSLSRPHLLRPCERPTQSSFRRRDGALLAAPLLRPSWIPLSSNRWSEWMARFKSGVYGVSFVG